MTLPAWLPPIQSCNGSWPEVVTALYAIFDRDFRSGGPSFQGTRIWWNRTVKAGDQFEEGFWHLISRTDPRTGERLPEFRRAERLPWCRPVIDHEREPEVLVWDYDKGEGLVRTYVWLRDFDYVVVLQRRVLNRKPPAKTIMFLLTAYHLDGDGARRWYERSYAARIQ